MKIDIENDNIYPINLIQYHLELWKSLLFISLGKENSYKMFRKSCDVILLL